MFGAWKQKKSETSLSIPSTLVIAILIALVSHFLISLVFSLRSDSVSFIYRFGFLLFIWVILCSSFLVKFLSGFLLYRELEEGLQVIGSLDDCYHPFQCELVCDVGSIICTRFLVANRVVCVCVKI